MNLTEYRPRKLVKEFFRDSTHWNEVTPRTDDIVIASCYKSGTTLAQQIVNILLNGNADFEAIRSLSPWVDSGLYAPKRESIEALASPRFLKTHLHPQALPWHDEWKYIYLGRDGRDVCRSLYDHARSLEEEHEAMGKGGTVDNGPGDFSAFWDQWVETGKPRWDFWENVDSWWKVRHQPNVLLVHYTDLVHDKPVEAERIARFLGCKWNSSICDSVCEYSSLDYMRKLELEGKFGSSDKNKKKTGLVNKGINGRWKDLLTDRQLARYGELVAQKLEKECANWLRDGGHVG